MVIYSLKDILGIGSIVEKTVSVYNIFWLVFPGDLIYEENYPYDECYISVYFMVISPLVSIRNSQPFNRRFKEVSFLVI